jgi:hypothetical protein
MADLRIDVAAEFKGKKAFKEADRATGSLDKAVGKLGKQLATVFATTKVIAFGKASVKAFLDDQKAATRLASAVKNLGLAYEQPSIDRFIAKLESTTGIVDDQLRPAFQALLTTTGSVTRSQEILSQAIDISRGSGIELTTVTQDLANAYVGNTKGLKKYNTGLTAAQLKAASFEEIQRKLNTQFSGASAAYLATYAGKMELLTTAADNAKETIGKGLVDALSILGSKGTTDIEKATTAMDELATSTANVIRGNAVVLSNLAALGGGKAGKIGGYIKGYFKEVLGIQALEDLGKATLPRPTRGFVSKGNANNVTFLTKAEKDAAKNAKELAALTKKNTDELKKQTALKKAGTVFDLEQIQLVAALKGKLSDNEKLRVEAQLALLNGNEAVATKLTNQILMAQDASGNLAKFLAALPNAKNPFEYLDAYLSYLAGKAAAVLTGSAYAEKGSYGGGGNTSVPPKLPDTNVPLLPSDNMITYNQQTGLNYNPNANNAPVINVTVQGNVIREQELINQVLAGAQLSSLSGSPSQIGRIAGMFS